MTFPAFYLGSELGVDERVQGRAGVTTLTALSTMFEDLQTTFAALSTTFSALSTTLEVLSTTFTALSTTLVALSTTDSKTFAALYLGGELGVDERVEGRVSVTTC